MEDCEVAAFFRRSDDHRNFLCWTLQLVVDDILYVPGLNYYHLQCESAIFSSCYSSAATFFLAFFDGILFCFGADVRHINFGCRRKLLPLKRRRALSREFKRFRGPFKRTNSLLFAIF